MSSRQLGAFPLKGMARKGRGPALGYYLVITVGAHQLHCKYHKFIVVRKESVQHSSYRVAQPEMLQLKKLYCVFFTKIDVSLGHVNGSGLLVITWLSLFPRIHGARAQGQQAPDAATARCGELLS